MIIGRCNIVLALSGTIPLLVSVAFALYMTEVGLEWVSAIVLLCIIISVWSIIVIVRKAKKAQRLRLKVTSINLANSEIFGSFIAYVFPLAFSGVKVENLPIILFSCVIYFALVVVTNTVYPSWIFPLLGYRLYRIKTTHNIEALFLSKQKAVNFTNHMVNVIELDSCCYLDVTYKK